jgi:hypothetical protein
MNINKNSWHFKVWKHFTSHSYYEFQGGNFCEYTRTIFIKAPACCLAIVLVALMVSIGQLVVAIPAGIVGYRPGLKEFWGNDYPRFLVPYDGLQIRRKGTHIPFELYPWHVLLPLVLIAAQWALIHFGAWPVEAVVVALIVVGLAIAYLYDNGDTETMRLLKAKAEAKHRMICPLITFTDEPTSTNIEE